VSSYRIVSTLAADGFDFATVIDVGANVGQFARAAVETFPRASVVSFEPLAEPASRFRRSLADRPNVRLIQSAVGRETSTIDFFAHPDSRSSSALKAHDVDVPPTAVPVTSLDESMGAEPLARPALLKLDVQGYELEVLLGARATLAQCDAVVAEVSFATRYERAPTFDAIYRHLHDGGWAFARPVDVLLDSTGVIGEMDALFVRR
jgi:FkbM family methyltransferase